MATSSETPNHSHHLVLLTTIAVMISVFFLSGFTYLRYLTVKYQAPQNYQDCAGLKDSIISLTYPQVCTTKDGQRFIQKIYERSTNNPTGPVITSPPDNCCSQNQLDQGYKCLKGCGPPVARVDDTAPPFSCLNPTEAYSRKTSGCPICLASNTFISAPNGYIKVTDLKVGMFVWSVGKEGDKIAVPILRLAKTPVPQNHRITRLVLSDGRSLEVSPNHPDISGKPVGLLQPGDSYDKSLVLENTLFTYWDDYTYDLLPDSETGFYFANGILLNSTLKY